ncbi:hypothetical protein A0H81_11357 [Grifola frondosa]|uniref:Uncharacterized protein n=1 Tax=Grifola frondosa TaxID=5627 RepID=A0A1C7LW37_GRIFR|nr:hypothetical protein A0H81_11357 [Grifola frondosa]
MHAKSSTGIYSTIPARKSSATSITIPGSSTVLYFACSWASSNHAGVAHPSSGYCGIFRSAKNKVLKKTLSTPEVVITSRPKTSVLAKKSSKASPSERHIMDRGDDAVHADDAAPKPVLLRRDKGKRKEIPRQRLCEFQVETSKGETQGIQLI